MNIILQQEGRDEPTTARNTLVERAMHGTVSETHVLSFVVVLEITMNQVGHY